MRNVIFLLIVFGFLSCTKINTKSVSADPELQGIINQTITDEGIQSDLFASSVDVDINTAVLGDPGFDDLFAPNRGCVFVYSRAAGGTQWTEKARLKNPGPASNSNFGSRVAIHGNYIVACSNDSVYVFKRFIGDTQWTQTAVFAPDNLPDGPTVSSIDIYGDYMVVGLESATVGSNILSGRVNFYKKTNEKWLLQNSFTSPDGQAYDRFGSGVSIHGTWAIVGARADHESNHPGRAYSYLLFAGNWLRQSTLHSNFPEALMNRFGCSVSIRGEYAIVGASAEGFGSGEVGSASIFKRTGSTWAEQIKLTPPDFSEDRFGYSVSMNENYAVVGGHSYAFGGGAVYEYNRMVQFPYWNFLRKETNPLGDRRFFASSVACDSTTNFVLGGNFPGAVHFGTF